MNGIAMFWEELVFGFLANLISKPRPAVKVYVFLLVLIILSAHVFVARR